MGRLVSESRGYCFKIGTLAIYVGKSISKLQMDIELKQTRVLI
jgi:hypothetical protein